MDMYVASYAQTKRAIEHLARFFFTSNVALTLIDNVDIKAAFAVLGCAVPSRKVLAGELLDAEFNRVRGAMLQRIKGLKIVGLSSGMLSSMLITYPTKHYAAQAPCPVAHIAVILQNRH